ncbi:PEP-CTERM sorting domain-containing protein [Piscinibacter sp.]|uniref:PEP-CTERM sorting domain-containing protein n=1 Tax=Piscinibacter sp. TaxID=1903157 RepID=UPI002BDC7157|nr:PEP-CTERM sorting domain-containing protein [Albitalea sp.]HUG25604.1 PEP-CTERM sorting domain-containing protein [Albitalea sp.]
MFRTSLKAVAFATFALAGASANAALVMSTPDCTASILNPSYTACGGSFEGNDKNQLGDVTSFIFDTWGQTVTFQGSSDEPGDFGPFTSNENGTIGTLTFDAAMDGPFVLSLKAGNQFSLFYYDGSGPAIASIDYSTLGVNLNNQGMPQGLSHASLYAGDGPVPSIPEPETYALMLAGLGVVGFIARRRRRG